MIETVYNQRNNPNTVQFLNQAGESLDFSATTRMVLEFEGILTVVDTDIDPALIDFSTGEGTVIFNLNGLGISADGDLSVSLINYDPTHTDGQIIVHAVERNLRFRFIDPIGA